MRESRVPSNRGGGPGFNFSSPSGGELLLV